MIARFDHRPMLTAALALATTVLIVVVVTLLITFPQRLPPLASVRRQPRRARPPRIWTPEAQTTDGTFNQKPLRTLTPEAKTTDGTFTIGELFRDEPPYRGRRSWWRSTAPSRITEQEICIMKRRLTILTFITLAVVAFISVVSTAPSPAFAGGATQISGLGVFRRYG